MFFNMTIMTLTVESMRFIMYVEGRVNWIDTDVTLLWPTLVQPVYWFPFTLFELDFEHRDKPGFSNILVFSNKGLATNYKSLDQNHNKLSPELKGRIQQLRSQIQQLMRLSTTRQGWRGRYLLTCLEVAFMTLVRHAESIRILVLARVKAIVLLYQYILVAIPRRTIRGGTSNAQQALIGIQTHLHTILD